jgi:hypothetical protein
MFLHFCYRSNLGVPSKFQMEEGGGGDIEHNCLCFRKEYQCPHTLGWASVGWLGWASVG